LQIVVHLPTEGISDPWMMFILPITARN